MAGILGKIRKKMNRLTGKMDQYQEAITFAEAGQPEYVREFTREEVQKEPDKLLVIGRESAFSREIIDYALEMAKRMSYEIVALNTAPLSCDTFKLFSSSRDKICMDFKVLSENNAELFKQEASREGIPFSHVVKFSETDEAIESVRKELGEIAFVVSESEEQHVEDRIAEGERLQRKLFVYSMV
jgi:hypothetical protein